MNEKLNFNSDIWGPKAWFFLDTIILAYPDIPTHDDMMTYKKFYTNLGNILPCVKCAKHYSDNLQQYPLTNYILSSKYKLIRWWLKIHNSVRSQSNKKIFTINEFIEYYTNQLNLHDHINKYYDNTENYYKYIAIGIIIIFILVLLLKK